MRKKFKKQAAILLALSLSSSPFAALANEPGRTVLKEETSSDFQSAAPAAHAETAPSWEEGSRGFFESQKAEEAVYILDNLFTENTNLGAADDATNLNNMLISLDIIEDCNAIRRSIGLNELRITHSAMAFCQVRANWSYENKDGGHAPQTEMPNGRKFIQGTSSWAENLDNYGDPRLDVTGNASLRVPRNSFDPWYYYEKDIADGKITGDGVTGHYENVKSDSQYTGAAFAMSDQPYLSIPAYKAGTCLQNFYCLFTSPQSFTVDEYRTMLQEYIDSISPAELLVTEIEDGLEYTGQPVVPKLTVVSGARTLTEGVDYTAAFTNNIHAGTAKALITGMGAYDGLSTEANFTIAPRSGALSITYGSSPEYTGDPVSLQDLFKITMEGTPLVYGQDYDVACDDLINAGFHTASVTLKGDYSGSSTIRFSIARRSFSFVNAALHSDDPSDSSVLPELVVTDGPKTLVEGVDYEVSFSRSGNRVVASATGKGNYTGTIDAVFSYTSPAKGDLSTVSIEPIRSVTYSASAQTPKPVVRSGSNLLIEGTDYELSYADNVLPGTAVITLSGKGNWTGTKTITFTILKRSLFASSSPASVSGIDSSYPFTGQAITPSPSIVWGGSWNLVKDRDYTLSYANNLHAGSASVTITGKGVYEGSRTLTFTIQKADLSSASVGGLNSSYTWTGSAISPSVTVKLGQNTLRKDTDYKVSYKNNISEGTASITISGIGDYTGTITRTFAIKKAAVERRTMYRLYNPNSGEHFYTADADERDYLDKIGWNYEGTAWIAPSQSGNPVYRMYNPNAGDHHYTQSASERDYLKTAGWKYEGIGWYSDDSKSVTLFRLYNPNAVAGAHHYTTSAHERDVLKKAGWRDEGIGWYGLK